MIDLCGGQRVSSGRGTVVVQEGEAGKEEVQRVVKIRIYPGYPLVVDGSSKHYYEEWHFRPGMVRETQENENI